MNISDLDLKKLWGKAAGHCSSPECETNCIELFEQSGDVAIGEMAHLIPQSKVGPRGNGTKGPNTYENLILLCPTHHTKIDKAPSDFPEQLLRQWKAEHERNVINSLAGAKFEDMHALCRHLAKILADNYTIHINYGPESAGAKANPLSEAVELWTLRKCDTIIPNNERIVNAIMRNRDMLSVSEWSVFSEFKEHAFAFARNTYARLDRAMVPRFPQTFQNLVDKYA